MRLRSTLVRFASAVALGLAGCGGPADPFVGKRPPSLAAPTVTPIPADAPVEWAALFGNVVYVQFGFVH